MFFAILYINCTYGLILVKDTNYIRFIGGVLDCIEFVKSFKRLDNQRFNKRVEAP